MKAKLLPLLLAFVPLLSACTNELAAINDRIDVNPVTITSQPKQAKIGDEVVVTLGATLEVDARSTFAEVPLSVSIGACFTEGMGTDRSFINSEGFCKPVNNALSAKYRLLNGSTYFEKFPDIVLRRGEKRTFEHSFSFTLDEADNVVLYPFVYYEPERELAPNTDSGDSVGISF